MNFTSRSTLESMISSEATKVSLQVVDLNSKYLYQKEHVCWVCNPLSWAICWALGKQLICRVSGWKLSVKFWHMVNVRFVEWRQHHTRQTIDLANPATLR
jgi:hypothetical protein